MKPVVAIVGRPNVGKSTLFNRIIGKRQALVNDTVGVTRDRHYANADWSGHEFIMIDTGGIAEGAEKSIQNFIKKQTLAAVDEADVLIFLFDGRDGATSLDKNIIELLRKANKPIIFAVNKAGEKRSKRNTDEEKNQFYELGIKGEIFLVSAEHGLGVGDLLDEVIKKISDLKFQISDDEKTGLLRVAVIGRPNAGKSTLINNLAGRERVIAHEMPGTTRDSIDVQISANGKNYTFVDTAGLKKKGKTIETLDKFSAIKTLNAIERAKIVLLMVDSNDGFTHQDSSLLDYAYNEGKAVVVVFNKWDDLKTDPKKLLEFYEEKLLKLHRVPFLYISAKTGMNVQKLFVEIDKLAHAMEQRLSTSDLNRILEDIKDGHNIPSYRGKAVKLNYATQVKTNPPSFVIFVNFPEGIGESYKRYLTNKLQDIIGNGVPIRIKFKSKNK